MLAKNKIGIQMRKWTCGHPHLRFARIPRIREDKRLADVDSLERIRELYRRQFKVKAKLHSV